MKGVKQDPSVFPSLKDEKFYDSWHRSFGNQVYAQGLKNVIDQRYALTTTNEAEAFILMQTYLYAVLKSKFLTTKGKEIVQSFESTRDARQAYLALVNHHRHSTASKIAARDIVAFLTTSTIGDGRIKGMATEYIS